MKVYVVNINGIECVHTNKNEAYEDIYSFTEENDVGDTLELTIKEMSNSEVSELPEFEGY